MTDFARRRINVLYETLREIRISIADVYSMHNRNSSFELSRDQRFLIDMYSNMYKITVRQLEYLERYNEQFDFSNRVYINGRAYTVDQISADVPLNDARQNTNANANANANQTATGTSNNLMNLNELLNETIRQFSNPVIVRPTEEQIARATRQMTFEQVTSPPNSSCPISLDQFESDSEVTQIIHCGHVFTPEEITRWFQSNVRCPVCRYDIRNADTATVPVPATVPASTSVPASVPVPVPASVPAPAPAPEQRRSGPRNRRYGSQQAPSAMRYVYDASLNEAFGAGIFSPMDAQHIFSTLLSGQGTSQGLTTDLSFNAPFIFDAIFRT
jgi:hypothetical protein